MSNATRSLSRIFSRIRDATDDAINKKQMIDLAEIAIDLVVKRTRLGYGIDRQFGTKYRLESLKESYKKRRKTFPDLSSTTSTSKSNLTLTGQMLASVKVIRAQDGKIRFGPTGSRYDTRLSNLDIAEINERRGRVFNRISQLEYNQILRYYRKTFGDLLKKKNLIR